MWSVPRGLYKTQSDIYDGAILQKLLPAKSFIVDIRLGFIYASSSRDRKYFYFSELNTELLQTLKRQSSFTFNVAKKL